MKVKICGLTTTEQVTYCVEQGANFCGFILNYPKSHRYINYQTAKTLTSVDKKNSSFVGVLVNPKNAELETFAKLNLDYFQIYGDYTKDQIKEFKEKYKKKIIVALQIKNKEDISKYKDYENIADIILFDSSGLHQSLSWDFDWIKDLPKTFTKMLAGNIKLELLENLINLTDIVDVSGALETNKVKDLKKIKKFLDKVKQLNG
jgi:phosphoribosylanthranilate isomerase